MTWLKNDDRMFKSAVLQMQMNKKSH